jgi:hypothetical protein
VERPTPAVFTEYDDTKRYLVEQLNTALQDTDDAEARIRVYHGPTPVAEREKLKRAFNADPKKHPLRILVATDAAREGLNLQNHCSTLFHFDLPWNPGRLEQRNGRIDRKLQKADVVHCHYFVYAQRPEDRVLQALVRKTHTIRRELGSLSQVLDDRIEARLRAGIRHKDVDAQVQAIEQEDLEATEKATVERELEAARNRQDKLRSEIDRLRTDLAKSRDWIRFDEDSFRDALSCSLELQRAPGLSPLAGGAFTFPELDKLAAADPTWRDTLDTLRTPRERDQKPWEWRQTATVRPVVFADQGDLDDPRCTCTSNTASPSACSATSARRASCSSTCRAPASRRPRIRSRACCCSAGSPSTVRMPPACTRRCSSSPPAGATCATASRSRSNRSPTKALTKRCRCSKTRSQRAPAEAAGSRDPGQARRRGAAGHPGTAAAPRTHRQGPRAGRPHAPAGTRPHRRAGDGGYPAGAEAAHRCDRPSGRPCAAAPEEGGVRRVPAVDRAGEEVGGPVGRAAPAAEQPPTLARTTRRDRRRTQDRAGAHPRPLRSARRAHRAGRPRLPLPSRTAEPRMVKDPQIERHKQWLGYLQPQGLVVAPAALDACQAWLDDSVFAEQQRLCSLLIDKPISATVSRHGITLRQLCVDLLGWEPADLVPGAATGIESVLTDYHETLRPDFAVRDPDPADAAKPWTLLIQDLPHGTDPDKPPEEQDERHWRASHQARFERLLRESQVHTGVLFFGTGLRLVHAPKGESSGHITFPFTAMTEVAGRPILSGLILLLGKDRLFTRGRDQRLPALLDKSRKVQAKVSTALAEQVLAALHELLRGFQGAHAHSGERLLQEWLSSASRREDVYGGLLTVILRLIFLLYAEDRGLLSGDAAWQDGYSVLSLFDRLREDADRFPDTMEHRYGAWAQLLATFRLVFDGGRHGALQLPARHGYLFHPDGGDAGVGDPPCYQFLEGRPYGEARQVGAVVTPPRIPDKVVWEVLRNLLVLDGERISYRTLNVEQIGSVYETMMGFRFERTAGPSLAVKPQKQHGAPVFVDCNALLAEAAGARVEVVEGRGRLRTGGSRGGETEARVDAGRGVRWRLARRCRR